MRGGQLATVSVPPVAQLLHLLVLVLREQGALSGLGGGHLQPVHLLLRGHAAAVRRADLLAEAGQPPGPGRGGLGALGQPALGGGELRLGRGPLGHRHGEHLAARFQPAVEGVLFFAQLFGLAIKLVGVAAAIGLVPKTPGSGLGQQAVPLRGQVLGAAQPFGQRGQREPGLLGLGQHGRGLLRGLVEVGLLGP